MDIQALEKLLAAGNDNALMRLSLGKLYFDKGDHAVAIVHLRAALAHDAAYSAAWKWLGRALMATERHAEAAAAFRDGIAAAEKKGDKQAVKEMTVFMRRVQKMTGDDPR